MLYQVLTSEKDASLCEVDDYWICEMGYAKKLPIHSDEWKLYVPKEPNIYTNYKQEFPDKRNFFLKWYSSLGSGMSCIAKAIRLSELYEVYFAFFIFALWCLAFFWAFSDAEESNT